MRIQVSRSGLRWRLGESRRPSLTCQLGVSDARGEEPWQVGVICTDEGVDPAVEALSAALVPAEQEFLLRAGLYGALDTQAGVVILVGHDVVQERHLLLYQDLVLLVRLKGRQEVLDRE